MFPGHMLVVVAVAQNAQRVRAHGRDELRTIVLYDYHLTERHEKRRDVGRDDRLDGRCERTGSE